MILLSIVLIVLVVLGAIPIVSHSPRWASASRGGVTLVLLIVVVLFLTGRL